MGYKNLDAYEIISDEELKGTGGRGIQLRHKKTGARVLLIENDDDNKVFSIGFRTPPKDSTGVPHIMEHSVLCGSKNYPTKDPFVELVKGSLNTFLNAMTYPDKTIYPIASVNDKDFQNLMHVYLDAVFYPNIYVHDEIFRQEGWSYKLEKEDGELQYNGVVYNEMKGAFSSPEGVLDRVILNSLYPDTTYANESGGDPECIPDLTYEQFLDFHRTFYHPSNSYIYLYGDMDMEEKLRFIDEEYLSRFDAKKVDSEIDIQKPFAKTDEETFYYSIGSEESEADNTYLSYNVSVGDVLDKEQYLAFRLLDYVLLSSPGAVLKKALIDAGIGNDIIGGYDSSVRQPMFSVIAKGANASDHDRFLQIIRDTLTDLAANGVDRKALKAAINYFEFRYREQDYGSAPKGLMYNLQVLDSWLYSDEDPFRHIEALDTFARMKANLDTDYYEQLIRQYLLDNPHKAIITLAPEKGRTKRLDQEQAAKLAGYKQSLSAEQIKALTAATKELEEYQSAPENPADLEKIPVLKVSDITREIQPIVNEEQEIAGLPVVFHPYPTNGIGYASLIFKIRGISEEQLPYLGLLQGILGLIDTEHFTYGELSDEINLYTGGIGTDLDTYQKVTDAQDDIYTPILEVKAKALYENFDHAFDMVTEIITASRLDDTKRIQEILAMTISRLLMSFQQGGHTTAVLRALSYESQSSKFKEMTGGIDYYRTLVKLQEHFDEVKDDVAAKLQQLTRQIFCPENLLISYTAETQGLTALTENLQKFRDSLYRSEQNDQTLNLALNRANEGFATASKVQYVAQCGNFLGKAEYTGALNILKVILNYDYMWVNLRVKGGAYGCMSGFNRFGEGYLVSYRDPHLERTLEVYQGIISYLENFEASDRDMTKYIIGTISNLDHPLTAAMKGDRSMNLMLSGVTPEQLKKERAQVLDATAADIRALAKIVQAVLDDGLICVIGSEEKIEADKEKLTTVTTF